MVKQGQKEEDTPGFFRGADLLTLPLGRLLLAVVTVLATYLLSTTALFQMLEHRIYDYGVGILAKQRGPHSDVVVVAIDEHSLERMAPTLGRWPWPRAALASVIDFCSEAKVIGFDVLYTERDWQYEQSDAVFVDAVKDAGNVISAIHLGTAIQRHTLSASLERFSLTNLTATAAPAHQFNAVLAPFDALLGVSAGVGHVNPVIDDDGIVRRFSAVGRAAGAVFPSLSLAAACRYLDIDASALVVDDRGGLIMGEIRIPLNAHGEFIMAPSAYHHQHYRIADVMRAWQMENAGDSAPISRDDFKGKVVLIGSLATGLFEDTKATSVSRAMDGVQIIASATENLINGQLIQRPAWSGIVLMALLVVLPLSGRFARPYSMLVFCMIVALLFLCMAVVLLIQLHVAVPITGPMLALFASGAVMGSLYWQDDVLRGRSIISHNEAKEDQTAMLVHDLRNAVAPILMSLEAFDGKDLDADVKELYLPIMKDSSELLLCQINSLLDIRRMEQGQMFTTSLPVDLWMLCDSAARRFGHAAEQSRRTLVFIESKEAYRPVVLGDKEILDRVLMNLLWNAIKYAGKNTTIELGYIADEHAEVIELFVRNHCRIIPEDGQRELFELLHAPATPGGKRKFRSMGLGLPFCRMAAEAHGGSATLYSPARTYDDGVEIAILLPNADPRRKS